MEAALSFEYSIVALNTQAILAYDEGNDHTSVARHDRRAGTQIR
jgi:hypothetical protein